MENAQLVTRYIKHLAKSAIFEGSTFNILSSSLMLIRIEYQTFHIPIRYVQLKKITRLFQYGIENN